MAQKPRFTKFQAQPAHTALSTLYPRSVYALDEVGQIWVSFPREEKWSVWQKVGSNADE